jgi:hypothetical protein
MDHRPLTVVQAKRLAMYMLDVFFVQCFLRFCMNTKINHKAPGTRFAQNFGERYREEGKNQNVRVWNSRCSILFQCERIKFDRGGCI